MITLDQAAARIGDRVIYHDGHAPYPASPGEEGVITSVSDRFVFVRYGNGMTGVATDPDGLEFAAPEATP